MEDKIMIRIRNNSTLNFSDCWLGAGARGGATETTTYRKIDSGQTSRYRHVEPPLANYRKIDIIAEQTRYLDTIDFNDHIGQPELSPGWYTFAYDIVGEKLQLTIVQEPDPS